MTWDWSVALDVLPELLAAFLRYTLVATILGTALAAVLGLAFAIVRRAHVPVLAPLVTAFIDFVRSTPLIVQLFFLFFVLPELDFQVAAGERVTLIGPSGWGKTPILRLLRTLETLTSGYIWVDGEPL